MGKKRRKPSPAPKRPPAGPATPRAPVLAFLERRARWLALALVLIASLRIVATYRVLSQTVDEPGHIAAGMEYIQKGAYLFEYQHPPLARAMAAVFPHLAGARLKGEGSRIDEGLEILYQRGRHNLHLGLARLGILPFFWLACFVVYSWGARYFGKPAAVISLLLFTLLPPVLAHAGLATTDMALAAGLGSAFLAALVWAEQPALKNSLLFGLAAGVGVLSKFSMFAFFTAALLLAAICFWVARRPAWRQVTEFARRRVPQFALAVLAGALTIWAGYRFSFGKVAELKGRELPPELRLPTASAFYRTPLPAPELFAGVKVVAEHQETGHPAYLLGEYRREGWWYYYPVVLALKTPLAFLLLLGFGCVVAFRNSGNQPAFLFPLALSLGILAVGLLSRINIGVRHLLPIYLGFSIVAAAGALELLRGARWPGVALAGLLGWLALAGALKHPDYIAYFNEIAAAKPEDYLVDSDLDWGQDLTRLAARLREAGARDVTLTCQWTARYDQHGMPKYKSLNIAVPNAEWIALSPSAWALNRDKLRREHPAVQFWVDRIPPTERVGATLLWHFTPETLEAIRKSAIRPSR